MYILSIYIYTYVYTYSQQCNALLVRLLSVNLQYLGLMVVLLQNHGHAPYKIMVTFSKLGDTFSKLGST